MGKTLFKFLKSMDLDHLFKGWKGSKAAERRAISRIKKGESPYYVLTEENKIPVDDNSRRIRAMKEGDGAPKDELYHSTWRNYDYFLPGSHFGTKQAALDNYIPGPNEYLYVRDPADRSSRNIHSVREVQEPDHEGLTIPVLVNEKRQAVRTRDHFDEVGETDLSDYYQYIDPALLRSKLNTLVYENTMEDPGSLSYINVRPNVRSRFAMHNPNWRHLKDMLAGTGALTLLPIPGEDF